MRIAQVAPLAEPVPPKGYGGSERVVSWLTEELVQQGHDVTLFASADSDTKAKLIPCARRALRLAGFRDHTASLLVMLDQVRRRADEFDVIHFHVDLLQFPLFQHLFHKSVTTMHGRLDLPDAHPIYRAFPDMPLVSISDYQRQPMPPVHWAATIHHGLPPDLYAFNAQGGQYLVFLGRIAPEKRPDRAIKIAKRAGVPLKIAAKVDQVDQEYFKCEIEPLLDDPPIEFLGEIDDREKTNLLGGALALVFPIDWPEPFGLVMIEAMSTGTPVIAWRNGSVPEVVEDGLTGAIVDSVEAAASAVQKVARLNRRKIRERFESRFTAARMAADYARVYHEIHASFAEQMHIKNSHNFMNGYLSPLSSRPGIQMPAAQASSQEFAQAKQVTDGDETTQSPVSGARG
jgi:glycosyltransferase involved in cell wall biosynthesis